MEFEISDERLLETIRVYGTRIIEELFPDGDLIDELLKNLTESNLEILKLIVNTSHHRMDMKFHILHKMVYNYSWSPLQDYHNYVSETLQRCQYGYKDTIELYVQAFTFLMEDRKYNFETHILPHQYVKVLCEHGYKPKYDGIFRDPNTIDLLIEMGVTDGVEDMLAYSITEKQLEHFYKNYDNLDDPIEYYYENDKVYFLKHLLSLGYKPSKNYKFELKTWQNFDFAAVLLDNNIGEFVIKDYNYKLGVIIKHGYKPTDEDIRQSIHLYNNRQYDEYYKIIACAIEHGYDPCSLHEYTDKYKLLDLFNLYIDKIIQNGYKPTKENMICWIKSYEKTEYTCTLDIIELAIQRGFNPSELYKHTSKDDVIKILDSYRPLVKNGALD